MWAYCCVSTAYGASKVRNVQGIDEDMKLFRFNKIDPVPRKYATTHESRACSHGKSESIHAVTMTE
jgi:hypothetical protein